jgi:hypothetical protein
MNEKRKSVQAVCVGIRIKGFEAKFLLKIETMYGQTK